MKKFSIVSLAFAAACSSQTAGNQTGRLQANADAHHFGIGSYEVQTDGVILFDRDGIELGSMKVSSPVADRRLIHFDMADGSTDEVEVYRPKADGSFFAPIAPQTVTTAAVADEALAPLFAKYAVRFNVDTTLLLAPRLSPNTLATTTQCTGGCNANNDAWTCTTPAGCVKAANASLGCTNPSQLPASIYSDTGVDQPLASRAYGNDADCAAGVESFCITKLGAGNYDYSNCWDDPETGKTIGECDGRKMISQWIASCPASTCTTSGQYDSVPRQDQCYDPGSCTFQQGTVGCTPYH